MTVVLVFLAGVAAVAGYWLVRHGLMSKPWLEVGVIDGPPGADAAAVPAAKIGLRVFLAVVGALFALFVSAWSMRMQTTDWWPLPVPGLLRSEEHTSELQSLMRTSYAVFCLKKKKK